MNLVVDTSVWSLFLRRKQIDEHNPFVRQLREHLDRQDCIHLIGQVLQELLDGVKRSSHFDLLTEYFEPFPLIESNRMDFIEAARLRNHCKKKGVQASPVDFLIASICINRNYPLLTADDDFRHISRHCGLMCLAL